MKCNTFVRYIAGFLNRMLFKKCWKTRVLYNTNCFYMSGIADIFFEIVNEVVLVNK